MKCKMKSEETEKVITLTTALNVIGKKGNTQALTVRII